MPDLLAVPYNIRLFESGGLRSLYHNSRYRWLAREIERSGVAAPRIIELGCFDAKTLHFIDRPAYYLGLDDDWENGLSEGRKLWDGQPSVELLKCHSAADIPERGLFDFGIALETLEHIPDDLLEPYLAKLSTVITGYLFVSVPYERGVVFLAKYLAKTLFFGGYMGGERCSLRDVFLLTFGQTHKVKRCDHKGFDERKLLKQLSKYFVIEKVSSAFPRFLPRCLSLTVGIVASPRKRLP